MRFALATLQLKPGIFNFSSSSSNTLSSGLGKCLTSLLLFFHVTFSPSQLKVQYETLKTLISIFFKQ